MYIHPQIFRLAILTFAGISAIRSQTTSIPQPRSLYDGSKEYSIQVQTTHFDRAKDKWSTPQTQNTRVLQQLKDFVPRAVKADRYGGRLDLTVKPTGFFYAAQIDGRWWTIDPMGHPMFHQAVVDVRPGTSSSIKNALKMKFGNDPEWMSKTQAFLIGLGFNGTGAWSADELIRQSPLEPEHPLAYSINLDIMGGYGKIHGGTTSQPGHRGYPAGAIFVFDPKFTDFADTCVSHIAEYAKDPNLFGYYSDNELPFSRDNLDGYLSLPKSDPGHVAAEAWLADHHASLPDDSLRIQFLSFEAERYYSIVSAAIRRYDPNHMYLGSRFTTKQGRYPEMFAAAGKFSDAVSINYYNAWTPDLDLIAGWAKQAGKPIIISEWYVKGADSGMANKTGAGWVVATQAERGMFYENYVLALIESKNVIGWDWFKYQDNDPDDPHTDPSNRDGNKGIVDIHYSPYARLVERMREINPLTIALADFFDRR